jgi:hypothetical protein
MLKKQSPEEIARRARENGFRYDINNSVVH